MSRSIAEHIVAKFFHQEFGITLYPYPGEEADLQTCCGLNIEVKAARREGSYHFKAEQIFKKQFDLAIVLRPKKRKRKRYMECAIWPLNDIRELIIGRLNLHHKMVLSLKPPEGLPWHEMAYPNKSLELPVAWR